MEINNLIYDSFWSCSFLCSQCILSRVLGARSATFYSAPVAKLWQLAKDKRRQRDKINHKWWQCREMWKFRHRSRKQVKRMSRLCCASVAKDFSGFLGSHLRITAATNELSWCFSPSAHFPCSAWCFIRARLCDESVGVLKLTPQMFLLLMFCSNWIG